MLAQWLRIPNAATASTTYLMVVLVVAATSRLRVAVVTSIASMLCLNFFFLPPVGTFTIADPQNWVALFAFLAVSLVASNLSAVARTRTQEALGRRDELARLFDLSRDVLLMTESREALTVLARSIARRFDLAFVAVAVPRDEQWDVYEAGARQTALDRLADGLEPGVALSAFARWAPAECAPVRADSRRGSSATPVSVFGVPRKYAPGLAPSSWETAVAHRQEGPPNEIENSTGLRGSGGSSGIPGGIRHSGPPAAVPGVKRPVPDCRDWTNRCNVSVRLRRR
jgi:hypothetical protein